MAPPDPLNPAGEHLHWGACLTVGKGAEQGPPGVSVPPPASPHIRSPASSTHVDPGAAEGGAQGDTGKEEEEYGEILVPPT